LVRVKYWGYFAAKVAAGCGLLWLAWQGLNWYLPEPGPFLKSRVNRFPQDLTWTTALLLLWLFGAGLAFLIVWDQRRRCRTCLRLLRMPVETGSWSFATLLSPPTLERICPYGHGTLSEPEVHNTSTQETEWRRHEDMWKELEELESHER
jgi:hypothetical protein